MARGVLVERFEIVGPYARNELGSLPGSLGRAPDSCFFRESARHCFVRVENELACAVARHKEIVDGHATEFEPLGRHCKYKKTIGWPGTNFDNNEKAYLSCGSSAHAKCCLRALCALRKTRCGRGPP